MRRTDRGDNTQQVLSVEQVRRVPVDVGTGKIRNPTSNAVDFETRANQMP
jgi:hypothetical protein